VGVSSITVLHNYVSQPVQLKKLGCVAKAEGTGLLNHFELQISQSRVEVWGTDPGADELVQLAVADGFNLPLTRGLLHFEDIHHSANKGPDPSHTDHTLVWDNIGFDGPRIAGNASFEVPDAGEATNGDHPGTNLGHVISASAVELQTKAVTWDQSPKDAMVGFNWTPYDPVVPAVRVNGGEWKETAWPFEDTTTHSWRAITVPIPLADVVQGVQKIEMRYAYTGTEPSTVVSNVSLILLGASKD
jgi:hypothetical protein